MIVRALELGRSSSIDSLPAIESITPVSLAPRLGPSALLDFADRAIIPRNVESPLVHLYLLRLQI